jgi:hypothetical protein
MSELVKKLSSGSHPVEVTLRPERTIGGLKECIDRKYVHIKFPNTRGGTELGVRLDSAASDLSQADFESGSGSAKLVGDLVLDYVKVRCIADINLGTFTGEGRLEVVEGQPAQSAAAS